ncbi:MAG: hypothetical protein AAB418_05770 [candidate division NC10 bacterium]
MRGRLLLAALAASLAVTGGVLAAPPEDHTVPPEQYTSEKARGLAARHAGALRELNAAIYGCMPWLDLPKQSIGFFRPKHIARDDRYFSLRVYVEQDPSPQFAALPFKDRASAMFSRYVATMLRRMTASAALLADPAVDGFTVIVGWLKEAVQAGGRPVHETIAVFLEKAAAADYLGGRAPIRDLVARAVVFGYDGETPLGRLQLQAWEDNFLATYQVANYQPEPGVTCR